MSPAPDPAAGPPLPVTAVIPAYNRPAMTARAVASALAQQPRPPAEVLVVDDNSSDHTAEAAATAGATVIRRDSNGGESQARNTGVEAATQPWIAFLDSDDRWLPGHLATLWPHAEDRVLVGASAWVARDGAASGRMWGVPRRTELASPAAIAMPANLIVASGALVRRDALTESGGFAPGMRMCADLDAWLRVLERGPGLMLPDIGVLYELHDEQVSDDRAAMRHAHHDVVAAYADRSWYSPRLLTQLDGAQAWDDLHDAVREGRYGAAVRVLGFVGRRPGRALGAMRLARHRRENRRAGALLTPPSPAA